MARNHLAFVLVLVGCGTDTSSPPDPTPQRTTWYQDAGPIVMAHCTSCHHDGGIAPFALATFEDGALHAQQVLAAVDSGIMPPWSAHAAPDCAPTRPWKGDISLTDAELATLHQWVDDGLVAGDPVQLTPQPSETLAGATHHLAPVESFTSSGDTDQFMCYALDPQIATAMYLTGWDVRPTNPAVVHHAVLLTLTPELVKAARDNKVIGKPLPCTAVPMTTAIGAWAPGGNPTSIPEGVGFRLEAGSGILVQIHYHPGGRTNDPDATAIDLRMAATQPPRIYALGGFGNAGAAPALLPGPDDTNGAIEFRIPANRKGHTETMRFTVDTPQTPTLRTPMFIMQPHEHFLGTRMTLKIHRPAPPAGEPIDECLVNSDWNFDWQRQYQYAVPLEQLPTLGHGDQVELECTYDNTLANPFVQRALADQHLQAPIDVGLGEQSINEMCLALIGLILPGTP